MANDQVTVQTSDGEEHVFDVTGDVHQEGFVHSLAQAIRNKISDQDLRILAAAGSIISSATSLRRGRIDSRRVAELEKKVNELLKRK